MARRKARAYDPAIHHFELKGFFRWMPGSTGTLSAGRPRDEPNDRLVSAQHGNNRLDPARPRGQQSVVAGLTLPGGLQHEFGDVRSDAGRYLLHGNFGHHFIEDRPHGLDEFGTIARHDALSGFPQREIIYSVVVADFIALVDKIGSAVIPVER